MGERKYTRILKYVNRIMSHLPIKATCLQQSIYMGTTAGHCSQVLLYIHCTSLSNSTWNTINPGVKVRHFYFFNHRHFEHIHFQHSTMYQYYYLFLFVCTLLIGVRYSRHGSISVTHILQVWTKYRHSFTIILTL